MCEQLTTRFAAVLTAEPADFARPVSPPGDPGVSVHGPGEQWPGRTCVAAVRKRIRATVSEFPFDPLTFPRLMGTRMTRAFPALFVFADVTTPLPTGQK